MEISYVCSLGQLCHVGMIFKRNKLKLASYPFDWTFSNFKNILHCIQDKFNIFLDKSYYVSVCHGTLGGHRFYDSNCHIFNHHDPLVNESHYTYFVRCVDRFNTLLRQSEHKLFVSMIPNMSEVNETIVDEIIEFNSKFKQCTSNYTLLCILHIPNKSENFHKFTKVDSIEILELHTKNRSDGTSFKNESDDTYLDTILNTHYKFNLKPIPHTLSTNA